MIFPKTILLTQKSFHSISHIVASQKYSHSQFSFKAKGNSTCLDPVPWRCAFTHLRHRSLPPLTGKRISQGPSRKQMTHWHKVIETHTPDWCGSVCWALPTKPKGCRFHSRSGHTSGLQVLSLVKMQTRGNQWMFLLHIGVSLPLILPPFPTL